MVHEQINDEMKHAAGRAMPRALSLTIKLGEGVTNLTADLLAKAFGEMELGDGKIHSLADLQKSGAALSSIPITEENIKSFAKYAREYNIDFALKKEVGNKDNVFHVFFKARDMESMTCAFDEFKKSQLSPQVKGVKKPSIQKAINDIAKTLAEVNKDKDRVKLKNKELSL